MKIWEDEEYYAFLDIFPKAKGHTLVIPKKHYRWAYDVPEFGKYWEATLKVTQLLQKSLKPTFVTYFTYGLVPHAHIHVLPRYTEVTNNDADLMPKQIQMTKEELQTLADKIKTTKIS